ncbi:MAG: SDR family oxidoreductase [Alphaproteobacteria bacterium]|nr:SDR family oxidoreductase [Alphaproteobacteria bacterium]
MKLQGKVAIVTGAASGIGAAAAELFAAEGAKVALADQDAAGLAATAGRIRGKGGTALSFELDTSQRAAVEAAVSGVLAEWRRIDVLMPCAGISSGGTVVSMDETAWDRVIAVNLKGPYLWLHAALPAMIAAKSGSVILIGSQLVVSSRGGNAGYIASKGAIATLAKTMAVDHARDGIRVNAVMPGVIDTPMPARSLRRYDDPTATRKAWEARHPMNRFGKPEEVAKAALFLASDDASFTTGSLLFVDGGWTAH